MTLFFTALSCQYLVIQYQKEKGNMMLPFILTSGENEN